MNYEKMWNDLKSHVQEDLRFYRDGKECSPIEAPLGVMHTSNFLRKMEAMEQAEEYLRNGFPSWDFSSELVYRFMMAVRRRVK